MTQKERLLEHLQMGLVIDPLQSWKTLGIYRLAARIQELRAEGHNITTKKKLVLNQFGDSATVAQYKLEAPTEKPHEQSAAEDMIDAMHDSW